jgi:hypothetical protein
MAIEKSSDKITPKQIELLDNMANDTALDLIGKEVWNTKISLDDKATKLRHILHAQLANFPDYIEKTSGKITQISITVSQSEMLIRVFSYNGATEEIINQKFEEFANFSGAKDIEEALKFVKYSKETSSNQQSTNELLWGMQKQSFDFNLKIAEKFENITLQNHEFTKILLDKFEPKKSILNLQNNKGNINLGDNNTQSTIIQNQAEFIDKLLQIADILDENKKSELLPSQLHYIEELEQEINNLKSKQITKTEAKSWLEKLEQYITVGGSLISLSEKITPIIQSIYKLF